jgi:hypothetical protein
VTKKAEFDPSIPQENFWPRGPIEGLQDQSGKGELKPLSPLSLSKGEARNQQASQLEFRILVPIPKQGG